MIRNADYETERRGDNMNVEPKERIEFFLAKIAGEDIDVKTLMPPGPINPTEQALCEIADRLDKIEDVCN